VIQQKDSGYSFWNFWLNSHDWDLLMNLWSHPVFWDSLNWCRPPLWSSGQSSCLQIQRPWFDSRLYQIFWEVVDLERGPFSLVSTIEELPGRKSSGSGLQENRDYGRRDPPLWPRDTLYPQKLALTSPTSGGRSVGIFRSRTKATEWSYVSKSNFTL
jgi:hypothetical protein